MTAEPEVKMNYVSLLPLELQVKIFAMLTVKEKGRCAVVCRAWRDTVYLPEFWREVTYTATNHVDPRHYPTVSDSLATRDIRKVTLQIHEKHGVTFIEELAQRVPNLQSLCVDCSSVMHETASYTARTDHDFLADGNVDVIALNLFHLVHLDLCGMLATDDTLSAISRHLSKLEYLRLGNCFCVTDVGIGYLTGQVGDVTTIPRLQHLKLQLCDKLTDTSLKYLSLGQPDLKFLCLARGERLSYSGMSFLLAPGYIKRVLQSGARGRFSYEGVCQLAALSHLRVINFGSWFWVLTSSDDFLRMRVKCLSM